MSLLGTRLKPRPPKLPSITAICTSSQFDGQYQRAGRRRSNVSSPHIGGDNGGTLRRGQRSKQSIAIEDIFIQSLLLASSCKRCKRHDLASKRSTHEMFFRQTRGYSRSAGYQPFGLSKAEAGGSSKSVEGSTDAEHLSVLGREIPRNEYRQLAETYDSPSDLWEQPNHNPVELDIPKKLLHMPLAPRLVLTPEQEDRPPYAARKVLPPEDEQHDIALRRFNRLLDRPLGTSVHTIWNSYQQLQGPRPRYLTDMSIHRAFRHLTWVEARDSVSSQRFFMFLNEVLAERIPVHHTQWNSSISFAARWMKNTTSEEVKNAIESWLRMENAGVQATIVTFNILFDAAIRAGRFALADTVHQEIKQRGLKPDRSFRVSMIYYAGLRRDGDAVRQAFAELVNAGEIVDTLVMNCVIVSLVRAGEGSSAENAYLKMKHLHETKFGVAGPRNWRERKLRGIEMHQTARQLRHDKAKHESSFFGAALSSDGKKEEAQRRAPIHPDAHTCRILIRYNAYTSGNLDRCTELLQETKDGGWFVHGSVYLTMFRGFYLHGGHAYTAWNRRSLEQIWADFIHASSRENLERAEFLAQAERETELGETISFFPDAEENEADGEDNMLSNESRPPYFTPNLARVVVHAFYKCAGRKRMLQVWAEIKERWIDVTPDQKMDLQDRVNKLIAQDSRYVE